jgi:hypothetical protein
MGGNIMLDNLEKLLKESREKVAGLGIAEQELQDSYKTCDYIQVQLCDCAVTKAKEDLLATAVQIIPELCNVIGVLLKNAKAAGVLNGLMILWFGRTDSKE